MSERSGIEIDYCPTCRGVWLDRGELDKIVERASAEYSAHAAPAAPVAPAAPAPPQAPAYGQRPYDDGYGRGGFEQRPYGEQGYRRKKKESWLSELFD